MKTSSGPLHGSNSMSYVKGMEEKVDWVTVVLLLSLSDSQSPQGWDNFTGSALHWQPLDDSGYNTESTGTREADLLVTNLKVIHPSSPFSSKSKKLSPVFGYSEQVRLYFA